MMWWNPFFISTASSPARFATPEALPDSIRGATVLLSSHPGMFKTQCGVSTHPANTRRRPNAVPILAHRLRRWPSIKPALVQRLVFAGLAVMA